MQLLHFSFSFFFSLDKKRVRPKKNLQRSLSDRRLPDIKDDINFKDTTALRTKPSRSSPDQIFSKSTTNLLRPSEPPPKLPDNVRSNIPQRPPRQNSKLNSYVRVFLYILLIKK